MPDSRRLQQDFIVAPDESGLRLDLVLSERFGDAVSRSLIKRSLEELTLNGTAVRLSHSISAGDHVRCTLLLPEPFPGVEPQAIPLDIVYEDEHLLVVNKPWGMPVHPAPGHHQGTLVNALLHHCGTLPASDPVRPGIVHRLDKDTSGLLVCAKSERSLAALGRAFANREVDKGYQAIVKGRPSPAAGVIEAPLARHPHSRKRQAVVAGGRAAHTSYRCEQEFTNYSRLSVTIKTGRTHQIRVHLAHIRHPVLGDPVYARPDRLCDKLCLAAVRLAFRHPVDNRPLAFSAPLPPHMQEVLHLLESDTN